MGPDRFAEVMRDEDVALDEVALAISAGLQSDVDVIEWLAALDDLAAACPTPTAAGVAGHLFGAAGFEGDRVTYGDWRNSCLDQVITRRRGIPITLSIVMIEVARRVGVELVGVGMPGHFIVGDVAGAGFYDPFHHGRRLDARGARQVFDAVTGGRLPWRDAHLDPTPVRGIVVRMLNNLASTLAARGDAVRLAVVMQMRGVLPELLEAEETSIRAAVAVFN